MAKDLETEMVSAKDLASGRPVGLVLGVPLESAWREMVTVWDARLVLALAPVLVWQKESALDVVPESVLVQVPDELVLVEPV